MRIVFLSHHYFPWRVYGVPQHIALLADYLLQQGHEVAVLTVGRPGLPRKEVTSTGLQVIRSPYRHIELMGERSKWWFWTYTLGILPVGIFFIRKFRPNIIHGHTVKMGGLQAVLLGHFNKESSVVLTLHGSALDRYDCVDLPRELGHLRRADFIICQKRSAMQKMLQWNIPREKVTIISNGIDIARFYPHTGENLHHPIITYAGRITEFKGVDLLVNAVPAILRRHPNAIIQIAGEGGLLAHLKEQVCQMKLTRHVIFLGKRNDIPELLRNSSVVVSLSRYHNSTDLALLEAMASGVPIVATDVEETSLIVKDGHTGLLAHPNAESISEKINSLLSNRKYADTLAYNAREYVVREHSKESFGQRHIELYERLLETTPTVLASSIE